MTNKNLMIPDDSTLRSEITEEDTASIQPYIIDRLEITFRDQLVSRRDMYKI